MNRYKRGKGWHFDNFRHYLASKGVKTKVDLNKYKGRWYSHANLPAWFQGNCKKISADYKNTDGKIKVVNKCDSKSIEGEARSVSKDNRNLKVKFFPFIEGDYKIEHLDRKYSEVIVGHPKKKYLWIMTRNKKISAVNLKRLISIAKKRGYDTSRLKFNKGETQ